MWRAGATIVVAYQGLGWAGMRRALRSAAVDHVAGGRTGLAAARMMGLPGSRIIAGTSDPITRRARGGPPSLADLERHGRTATAPAVSPLDADCAVVFTS